MNLDDWMTHSFRRCTIALEENDSCQQPKHGTCGLVSLAHREGGLAACLCARTWSETISGDRSPVVQELAPAHAYAAHAYARARAQE